MTGGVGSADGGASSMEGCRICGGSGRIRCRLLLYGGALGLEAPDLHAPVAVASGSWAAWPGPSVVVRDPRLAVPDLARGRLRVEFVLEEVRACAVLRRGWREEAVAFGGTLLRGDRRGVAVRAGAVAHGRRRFCGPDLGLAGHGLGVRRRIWC